VVEFARTRGNRDWRAGQIALPFEDGRADEPCAGTMSP